mmetsp:Transcript_5516/g.12982  ORF Transcript_5516/g.12982 Transcript_5516/m.12982 type:complete len:179 (+) Transcript_5516:2328-2864(+)
MQLGRGHKRAIGKPEICSRKGVVDWACHVKKKKVESMTRPAPNINFHVSGLPKKSTATVHPTMSDTPEAMLLTTVLVCLIIIATTRPVVALKTTSSQTQAENPPRNGFEFSLLFMFATRCRIANMIEKKASWIFLMNTDGVSQALKSPEDWRNFSNETPASALQIEATITARKPENRS